MHTLLPSLILLTSSLLAPQAEAAFNCKTAYEFVTGRPKIEIAIQEKRDGTPFVTFMQKGTLAGVAVNQLLKWLHPALKLDHFAAAMNTLAKDQRTEVPYFTKVAEALGAEVVYSDTQFLQIPRSGPVLYFANHPLSGLDGLAIASMTSKFRTDVKVLANQQAADVFPGFADHAIFVDTSGTPQAKQNNTNSIRKMQEHLRQGGVLILFPAGKVSRYTPESPDFATDLVWRGGILKLIDAVPQTQLVPVYVREQPSPLYLRTIQISRPLALALTPSEVAKGSLKPIRLEVGNPFSPQVISGTTEAERLDYLRKLVFNLAGELWD